VASLSPTARVVPALSSGVRAAPAASGFLAAGAVAIAVYFLLRGDAQSIFYEAIGLSAVAAISVGAVRNLAAGARLPWHLFSLGLLGQVAGDAVFTFYEVQLNREPPTPSIADAFYLGGYPLLAAGVFLIARRQGGQASRGALLDTVVVFAGVALVQWVFFIDPYSHAHYGSEWARLVAMAYPAADILLLVMVAQLLVGTGRRTRSYALLVLSLALWVVADEIYGLDVNSYAAGSWLDAFWLGSYVCWGAAALDPSMTRLGTPDRRKRPRLTTTRMALLSVAALTASAALLTERTLHHRVHAYILGVGGALLSALVLLRLAGLVHAVERARRAERLARQEAEQAQKLLARQNRQLVELDRLKDEFVSGVSHELRTPLTSISGYVELLLEEEASNEKRDYLAIVDRNTQRLLALVSDLLFTARLQAGRLELERSDVDMARLVDEAIASAAPRAETAGVKLRFDGVEHARVQGERLRLAQMLDNLVSNAIKFTPAGGRVTVDLAERHGMVRIEVSDTGIGIAEGEREKLFERFFRSQAALERQIQGTGLGLYISKAIIDAHGGRIGVQSEEGRGTTFVVELPAL
jgi:signal transduction histidine kinase